jgi:SNF2 family DNA or RNA helicase
MLEVIVKKNKSKYNISSSYDKDFIENIKSLKDRTYDTSTKKWLLDDCSLYNLIFMYKQQKDIIFFDFVDSLEREEFKNKIPKIIKKIEKQNKLEEEQLYRDTTLKDNIEKWNESSKTDDWYIKYLSDEAISKNIKPFPHQLVGAKFINHIGSALIAADLGTGKTLLTLLGCELAKFRKIFIVVPNSLKYNWQKEVHFYIKDAKAFVLNSKINPFPIEECKYIIVNFDYFSRNFDFDKKIKQYGLDKIDAVVVDEAHMLKNTKAARYKNFIKLYKKLCSNFIMLTGTPVPNRVEELYVILNTIRPSEFKSKQKFYNEYCGLYYDMKMMRLMPIKGGANLEELNKRLENIMFRVKKSDVLKDLPEMIINKIYLEMNPEELKQYKLIESGFKDANFNNLSQNQNINNISSGDLAIVILGKLRQYTSSLKVNYVNEMIERLNDENEKVVVFDCYKESLNNLYNLFKYNSRLYHGDVSAEERQKAVDLFQDKNSSTQNMFLSVQTGNAGITLTESSNLFLLTQSYVPAENDQCYARLNRIGQKNSVNIFIIQIINTIDTDIDELITEKQKVIKKVIDNEDYEDTSEKSVIGELLEKFRNKYKKY